ncbi:MAG: methyltransferase [Pseudomonadota bacterium]
MVLDASQHHRADGHAIEIPDSDLSDDAFLGGRLQILQLRHGYRAGLDAVLLAAAVGAAGDVSHRVLLDAGAGVGTVGLCVAARLPSVNVTLAEIQPELVALAERNIHRNGLQARVHVALADITSKACSCAEVGLEPGRFQDVVMNPPYHMSGAGTPSPQPSKSLAHAMPSNVLDDWVRFGVRVLVPGGRILVIHKIAALPDLLTAMSGRFGAISAKPIQSFDGAEVSRVLVTGIKGSRAPFRLCAPLVLHTSELQNGRRAFAPDVDAILRHGAALSDWPT